MDVEERRIRSALEGRISGCQVGKPLEPLAMIDGPSAVRAYLPMRARYRSVTMCLPCRAVPGSLAGALVPGSCRGQMVRSEPDDDINSRSSR